MIDVFREVRPERVKKASVVLGRVEFLCPEDLTVLICPSVFKVLHLEEFLEVSRDIFDESDHSVLWMFVAEDVENKTLLRFEGVSIFGNPFSKTRFEAPR